uniref:Uncharacterized protein n=1 Tax=Bracon brevicornis TaxID=1563983 RepID=A0A6V7HQI9_9HYME
MSSLARRRQTNSLFGSKRWWAPACWATRSHQEAYLRKLYGRKNTEGNFNAGLDINEWPAPGNSVYDPPVDAGHYLDNFLKNRKIDDAGRPALPSPSPTEKCVEYLAGAVVNNVDISDDEKRIRPRPIEITEHNLDSILQSNYRDE